MTKQDRVVLGGNETEADEEEEDEGSTLKIIK